MLDIMKKCLQRNPKDRPSFIQIQQYIEKYR